MLIGTATTELESSVDELTTKVSKLSEIADGLIDKLVGFAFDVLIAIVILIVGRFILKFIRNLVKKILNKSSVDIGVVKFADSIVKVVGYIIIIIIICGQIGIETTSLITLLGTASLTIGLALEGCFSNFAGGVLLLVTKPFVVGDYIIVNGVEGVVDKIDLIYTSLKTVDNKSITIPNGTVSNETLINVTHQTKRRVDVEVGIHYDDDIKKAKDIATKVMNSCPYILKEDDNVVVVKELGESSVVLAIRMWTSTEDYWNGLFYLNENIKREFEANQIRIPYNQLDVHVHNAQ